MFGRKEGQPPNYKSLWEGGDGLWEIWYDDGQDSSYSARPVKSMGLTYLSTGPSPIVFLYDDEASAHAHKLARKHPDKRFAVKLRNG